MAVIGKGMEGEGEQGGHPAPGAGERCPRLDRGCNPGLQPREPCCIHLRGQVSTGEEEGYYLSWRSEPRLAGPGLFSR